MGGGGNIRVGSAFFIICKTRIHGMRLNVEVFMFVFVFVYFFHAHDSLGIDKIKNWSFTESCRFSGCFNGNKKPPPPRLRNHPFCDM